jgi:hypothetical protein
MGFILDAIKGSHAEHSEDRLTQVFCACFNNSRRFRQLFLRFIGYKRAGGRFHASTQEQYAIRGASCRADILIGKPGFRPSIVVESKIDSPLKPSQLKAYNRVGDFSGARKIALVKHYFAMERVRGWTILHWADFHSTLKVSRPVSSPVESFVLRAFVELLEELGMARALVIERERLRDLAQFMKTIREPKPARHLGSKTPFETATEYLGMLEEIVNQMHEEPLFRKRLGKRTRYSPWLMYYWKDEADKADKKVHPWLGVDIRLRKAYRGVASISTGIFFDSKRGSFRVETYTSDKEGNFLSSVVHRGDLRFESYARKAITFWKKKLR